MTGTFIIEDGYNTSYIDTTIMALFYKPTHLTDLLIQLPEKSKFAYLQDIISTNVIDQVRRNFSVDASLINEIRNYSFICGWKEGCSITELYNAIEYLEFLIKGFDFFGIKCDLIDLSKKTQEYVHFIKTNYITLLITENSNIKLLLEKWTNSLLKKNTMSYHFTEIPIIIPIYLNRYDDTNQINNYKIDIKKKIRFNNKGQNDISWVIHSIICFSNTGKGHYYCIINMDNNVWCLFNNSKIPSVIKIDITDEDIANKIKQECVIVLYRLDDVLCKF
jgi:hypothetical protein